MFSVKNSNQADMCRFCWMCRHICPVAGASGSEAWGPRARGLMISMIERGIKYDTEIAEAMYHCTLCDACANDCVTNWKPSDFIREARRIAVVEDIAPKKICDEIINITEKNNIFGLPDDSSIIAEINRLNPNPDYLLYIGQTGRTVSALSALAYIDILKKNNVNFTILKNEPVSGAFLADLMDYTGDVQALADKNAKAIKKTGVKTIISMSPYDAAIMREKYTEWNLLPNINVVTATAFLDELIKTKVKSIKQVKLRASVQEPVKLTRGLNEELPILNIIDALKIDYVPLYLHGKMSRCIGTPIMDYYDSNVVELMVRVRCDDARRINSNSIITCCPDDYYLMKKYADPDMSIIDLFELLSSNIK